MERRLTSAGRSVLQSSVSSTWRPRWRLMNDKARPNIFLRHVRSMLILRTWIWKGFGLALWFVRRRRATSARNLELASGLHPDDWLAPCVLPSHKNLSVHCSWL